MSTKLIEVALPLEEISAASRRDKDKKTGTIKNVHKCFAPMPTPAWRALLFAALIDDPGEPEARAELLEFVKRLVPAHGGAPDEQTLAEAHKMLMEATGGNPPTVFDPFCGGGSTLVEAQRLGLPAAGSDLNPVPVLITRVLTELMPQVRGCPPLVGTAGQLGGSTEGGLGGFLADCRHYAERVRAEVWNKVGHLYPEPPGGGTVVAWLWARTVTCPNPACRAVAPLVSSFWLSKRKGAETWVEPVGGRPGGKVTFEVRTGAGGPKPPSKTGRGGTFRCLVCSEGFDKHYLQAEGMAGRMCVQLLAVAVDREGKREYLSPAQAGQPPSVDRPEDAPDIVLSPGSHDLWCQSYGVTTFADVFTNRQLVALGAFADSVAQVGKWVCSDGGDEVYAKAVASVLGLCVGKLAHSNSTQVRWNSPVTRPSKPEPAFSRHALPMLWDFTEANPFGGSVGDWRTQLDTVSRGLRSLPPVRGPAQTVQAGARGSAYIAERPLLLATDPPYFAQIGYADLSDYFYIWLRRALAGVHPDLFATVATPKADELIAAPYRHQGSKEAATRY
ncbi:MAG: DUF1156 domain-containing protein, partial [Acidimicrobiales bacterium]